MYRVYYMYMYMYNVVFESMLIADIIYYLVFGFLINDVVTDYSINIYSSITASTHYSINIYSSITAST